ncbi:hypothetical protein [Bradyrhizobium tunisiense]|uniref:hypothetical protein n=1 Tax=Bradyrhizobium tunisiense TaxID=3278709 RepID=UPI0035D76E3A
MPGTPDNQWPQFEGMSATADEVAKQAIQDVARHEEQLVKLIFFHDDRALRVIAVYGPLLGVLMAGTIALYQAGKLTLFLGLMIGGTGVSFMVGFLCAFAALWNAPIYLPSRKPPFWQWALKHDVELREVAMAYVEQSAAMVIHNERHSLRASGYLTKAYTCGVAAPFAGAALVWMAYWSR